MKLHEYRKAYRIEGDGSSAGEFGMGGSAVNAGPRGFKRSGTSVKKDELHFASKSEKESNRCDMRKMINTCIT